MEAIAELIAALIGAFVQAVIGLLAAVAALAAIILEFVFIGLTQGLSAASQRYKHRTEERAAHVEAAQHVAGTSANENTPSINLKHAALFTFITAFVMVCGVVAWAVSDRIRKQQVTETRTQVKQLADKFADQIKDVEIVDLESGRLRDHDSWQQPLELFVDKTLLGALVVVRSSGPDRKSGSIDDILATRLVRASAKDVGGELANRGIKALRDRVAHLLPGGDEEQLPQKMDVGE